MKRGVRFFVVTCFLFGSSCSNGDGLSIYTVSGDVTDAFSGDGISGARVTFISDTLLEADTKTGRGGSYEMSVESDVRFGQLRAEKDGYQASEQTVFFDSTERRVDFTLRPQ